MEWKKESGEAARELKPVLEPLAEGLSLKLVELVVSRHRGGAQVRAIIWKPSGVGVDECSAFHHAITPRLELSFGPNISLEVSSPGIERLIRDGEEASSYVGCAAQFYLDGASDWKAGVIERVTESTIEIKGIDGMEALELAKIAKAKLCAKAGPKGNFEPLLKAAL